MKTRYFSVVAVVLMSLPLTAQETYQDTKLVANELNGTARYVGMGGALEALGADISTISSNPAGVGLFRSGQVAVSGGMISQQGETTSPSFNNIHVNINGNKNNASFDQAGFVYAMPYGRNGYMNFAFNYRKSRNFDQILTAANKLQYASQNKLTSKKFSIGSDLNWNALDAHYSELMDPILDSKGKKIGMDYLDGTDYVFGRYQKGYIGEYSFNVSGNINNRVFLGVTMGLHDVNYRSNSYYTENLEKNATVETWEDLRIDGSGFDIKAGIILRPIATSPFRIGAYVHTPIWYDLNLNTGSDITMGNKTKDISRSGEAKYDFKVYTPWKYGVSLGHTVGRELALGLTYEFADYGTIDNRVNDGGYYDNRTGGYYENSLSDGNMNSHTRATLKAVSTLKVGVEYKPLENWAIRLGYNYQSPIFEKGGFRDGSIASPGNAYASSTNYTNWESTNRVTCGFGYSIKRFFVDMAYQYARTNGNFYPFMSYYAKSSKPEDSNIANGVNVSHKRHQVLFTLGYRF